jgi:hypothetical protein
MSNSRSEPRPAPQVAGAVPDEVLITDARGGLTPAQMVEGKLLSILQGRALSLGRLTIKSWARHCRA